LNVKIKLFAVAKELAGRDEVTVDVPYGANVYELRDVVARDYPALSRIISHALWAVNAEYATTDTQLTEQSEVALIPPVSGG
jgi:molybdopterin converting factor subunit 1